MIQTYTPTHAGSLSERKPLYYMCDESQNTSSRARICPTGWAKDNGDASALVDVSDELNCDEFFSELPEAARQLPVNQWYFRGRTS
ncbi:hypothetical protein [Streptomyces sp. NPDC002785]|uniref:hypothetical protein n=1 Tax=Streptomyces sp. NPDC002785 TaxID=3154543 RepID=UPI00332FE937